MADHGHILNVENYSDGNVFYHRFLATILLDSSVYKC